MKDHPTSLGALSIGSKFFKGRTYVDSQVLKDYILVLDSAFIGQYLLLAKDAGSGSMIISEIQMTFSTMRKCIAKQINIFGYHTIFCTN
jgi:hypothetical protein